MKSGFVAILGRPNVGKSTIINNIVNARISIVTEKAQTTRNNIIGIYNDEDAQIVFVDTPGIHKPNLKIDREMNSMAFSAAHDVDLNILVIDASQPFGTGDQFLVDHLDLSNAPLIIVFNKIDLARLGKAEELKITYYNIFPKAIIVETVAKEGFNIDELLKTVKKYLPKGPAYYPVEMITDKDEIFMIKEIIREKALIQLRDEVPHALAVYIDDINWESNPLKIYASIIIEKESQKAIVIGAGGRRIKEIGIYARHDIERYLKKHIFIELQVKVDPNWRSHENSLIAYGYKYDKK